MRALPLVAVTWIFLSASFEMPPAFGAETGGCSERPPIPSLDPKNKFPDYTAVARKLDLQGAFRVEFSITKRGRVKDAKIVEDSEGMRGEALKGLSAVRFLVPADWKAASCRYSMRLVYRLYRVGERTPEISNDPATDVTVGSTATSIARTPHS
jgi:TonB family protein